MQLEIGDRVFVHGFSHLISVEKVKKVFKTTAITDYHKFDRELYDGYCNIKARSDWGGIYGQISNERLEKEWQIEKIIRQYWQHKENITTEQLQQIYEIFKSLNLPGKLEGQNDRLG